MEKFIKYYCRDWRFLFKLAVVILALFGLLTEYLENVLHLDRIVIVDSDGQRNYLWAVYDQSGKITHLNYAGYTMSWISFFTTQTNVLVFGWFLIAVIRHRQEGIIKPLRSYFSLSVAVYITVTCLIYNILLLLTALSNKNLVWTGCHWSAQLILHTFVPILTVIYVVVFAKHSTLVTTKLFYRQKLGWYLIYPFVYGIYGIVKGIYVRRRVPIMDENNVMAYEDFNENLKFLEKIMA